jgi:hypothetical protein
MLQAGDPGNNTQPGSYSFGGVSHNCSLDSMNNLNELTQVKDQGKERSQAADTEEGY